jgi:hypothetical protein
MDDWRCREIRDADVGDVALKGMCRRAATLESVERASHKDLIKTFPVDFRHLEKPILGSFGIIIEITPSVESCSCTGTQKRTQERIETPPRKFLAPRELPPPNL